MVEIAFRMREEMNISKYDFHDGYLIDMIQINNNIEITMESAEISDEELQDDIILSDHSAIAGKLHIEGIKNIQIDGKDFFGPFEKTYDEGNIYSFDIKENKLTLLVSWLNHPPKICGETKLFKIEIEAKKIWWENIPDLVNPYW